MDYKLVFKKDYTPEEIITTYLPGKCIRSNGGIDDFSFAHINITGNGTLIFEETVKLPPRAGVESIVTITSIGCMAFTHCKGLKFLDLSKCTGLTTIGDSAFDSCLDLETVKLPESLTSIEPCAFQGCIKLKNINFPKTLKSIGANAFKKCVELGSNTKSQVWEFTKDPCIKDGIITLPSGLENIGELAFGGCIKIKVLILSQTIIGSGAFIGCYDLKHIHIVGKKLPEITEANFVSRNVIITYTEPLKDTYGYDDNEFKIHFKLTRFNNPRTFNINSSFEEKSSARDAITQLEFNYGETVTLEFFQYLEELINITIAEKVLSAASKQKSVESRLNEIAWNVREVKRKVISLVVETAVEAEVATASQPRITIAENAATAAATAAEGAEEAITAAAKAATAARTAITATIALTAATTAITAITAALKESTEATEAAEAATKEAIEEATIPIQKAALAALTAAVATADVAKATVKVANAAQNIVGLGDVTQAANNASDEVDAAVNAANEALKEDTAKKLILEKKLKLANEEEALSAEAVAVKVATAAVIVSKAALAAASAATKAAAAVAQKASELKRKAAEGGGGMNKKKYIKSKIDRKMSKKVKVGKKSYKRLKKSNRKKKVSKRGKRGKRGKRSKRGKK